MSIDFEALQNGEIFIWQSVWLKKFLMIRYPGLIQYFFSLNNSAVNFFESSENAFSGILLQLEILVKAGMSSIVDWPALCRIYRKSCCY